MELNHCLTKGMADIFDETDDNEDIGFANKEWNKLNRNLEKVLFIKLIVKYNNNYHGQF